jgi:hypothetical protein
VTAYSAASLFIAWILLSTNAISFQVIAYISIATVIMIISLLYMIFWIVLLKKENSFKKWSSLGLFIAAGFATSMLQITLLNMLRQWLTG